MPRYINIFAEDYKEVPAVGTKRGHLNDLQDHNMSGEEAIKKAKHDSLEISFGDRQRHAIIT